MARMIPSFMDERTPPGERDVFNMLASGPDDWVALHSLDLAPWNKGLRTEVDFVVIIPDAGILCIEVKSHDEIAFVDDRWLPPEIKRSPFKQAMDGRYAFYRRLKKLAPAFRSVPVVHACIFPNARFSVGPNLSVQPWELMDKVGFRNFSSGEAFCADLKFRVTQSIDADEQLSPLRGRLSAAQLDEIAGLCHPVQKRRPDKREEILRQQDELDAKLRLQQKPILKLAALNPRLIVAGAAGTGKTLVAMEVARRAALQGRRVALLCFNELVGDWMEETMSGVVQLPNLIVGRAIRVMAGLMGIEIPERTTPAYWNHELPARLEEKLTNPDLKSIAVFDYVVVDEAQDILGRTQIWNCLTQFIAGGIKDGSFALFGDFDTQVLSGGEEMKANLAALQSAGLCVRWELDENCRNYRIVGETALRLSGFPTGVYSGFMRAGGGMQNYDIGFYENDGHQLALLEELLRESKNMGFNPSEITVLSFRSDEMSAASRLSSPGVKLRPAWQSTKHVSFASVQAFKGMENKFVILTDVTLGEHDFQRTLFYTGITRATEKVRILCNKASQDCLMNWIC